MRKAWRSVGRSKSADARRWPGGSTGSSTSGRRSGSSGCFALQPAHQVGEMPRR
ncbi:MAG: hypothetical protein MZU91_14765 [Desulfosudis oleivorans]|nr:hypothetical protein [Desulfosudis oleivorans]